MNSAISALKLFLTLTVVTGLLYPILVTLIAKGTMPNQANGSLLVNQEQLIGSLLIAQNAGEPQYFWARPSAIGYDPLKPSGGSNLGPTSQKLKDLVIKREQHLGEGAPSELLYASGSGLDPHITLEAAYFQIPRVAQARSISEERLKELIDSLAEGGVLGPSYVNVLKLNWALNGL